MTLKHIAVEGLKIEPKQSGVSATISPLTLPDNKVSVDSKKVYAGGVQIQIVGAATATCTQSAPIVVTTIPATSQYTLANTKAVNRVDDEGPTLNIPGTTGGGGPCTVTLTPVITDANQDKVRAE